MCIYIYIYIYVITLKLLNHAFKQYTPGARTKNHTLEELQVKTTHSILYRDFPCRERSGAESLGCPYGVPSRRSKFWVFIKGGCSGLG